MSESMGGIISECPGDFIGIGNRENGRVVELPIEVVRGIHFDSNRKVFTVYFNSDKSLDSRLLRETNLVPAKEIDTITFILGGVPKPIRISEIIRYTSGIK